MPVRLLQQWIDSTEFNELMAYDRIKGISRPVREAGTIAATIANCHIVKGQAKTPQDFMPIAPAPVSHGDVFAALKAKARHGNDR